MKNLLSQAAGFIVAALLGAVAVVLAGCAIRGDVYALALLVVEILFMVLPEFFHEGKLPKKLDDIWSKILVFWALAVFMWVFYRMQLAA